MNLKEHRRKVLRKLGFVKSEVIFPINNFGGRAVIFAYIYMQDKIQIAGFGKRSLATKDGHVYVSGATAPLLKS